MEKELLRVEDLTVKFRTYNGEVTAVNNLELLLNENETLGIVGESGSGKSTLLKLLMRYWDPDSGKLTMIQKDVPAPEAVCVYFNGTKK